MNSGPDEQREPFKRLFFALPCALAQRRAIAQWRSALGQSLGRPVPAENFHLTLMFLGAVPVRQIPAICSAAAAVRPPGEPLRVALDRLDVWRRAGILLLAPEQASRPLLELVYALQQAMLPLGLEDAPREFRPHLTLMRDYRASVPESATAPDFQLSARHFVLFESHKGRYRALAQWPLEG
ncbi:RNA 2',3'-cyclic phosphodiesterase [Pseudomonas sp. Irchel s3a18]|uniref:RNA 2',3'-cyclic phosphodiesterase n=1 Tax=Pseudomonas sp. Irchel s3a18 TaxID=2009053 RepID=UPI000BA36709|nr:RNA 2',3'-cyclic phosphodiesterase [Pseudomonas sp. Irchel s3a18]